MGPKNNLICACVVLVLCCVRPNLVRRVFAPYCETELDDTRDSPELRYRLNFDWF